jgi:acid phosphatase type 7
MRYPHLVLSGHVHSYQRFTVEENDSRGAFEIACVVAGNGGYSKLGKLHKIDGAPPEAPMPLSDTPKLDAYDEDNFGFLRFEVDDKQIVGSYFSAAYEETTTPRPTMMDRFIINLPDRTVTTPHPES